MHENTIADDLKTLRHMLLNVVSNLHFTAYGALVLAEGLSQPRIKRLQKDYPSDDSVIHQMLDWNKAEKERRQKKAKALAVAASVATSPGMRRADG